MKRKSIRLIVTMVLVFFVSCNEPETVVTNYVHSDGSITRKVEMRSIEGDTKKRFQISDIQIPFDNTWSVKDTFTLSQKGDTTWIRKGEKLFKSIDELNSTYKADSSVNKSVTRHAGFHKRFKWFNTEYRFSENIDKLMSSGYPVRDFLNQEELLFFYSPESLIAEKENGPDSLKYKALADSVKYKTDFWSTKNIVSEWISVFAGLTAGKAAKDLSFESLKAHENDFIKTIQENDKKFDSLWAKGVILNKLIGEDNALKYRTEADSALSSATKALLQDFKNYSVRIVMPGKLIGTNGFIDSSQILLWPVKSDYFMTEPYEMWAESKTTNSWAWIVSGLFLAFVLTGVVLRIIKKD